MANIFLNIPVVVGVGPAVNISAMGVEKTIVVQGTIAGAVTLEISCDTGVSWCPLVTFTKTGKKVIPFAANRIRAVSSGITGISIDIGANDDGGLFVVIPPPPANGVGAAVNIAALGNFTTIVVQGSFGGGVVGIQVSEDGVDFAECATFADAGCLNKVMVGNFARAVSRGAGAVGASYAPVSSMGAINDDNADLLAVQEEGVLVGSRPIMNFIGGAVTATDDPGNNRVNVTITAAALTNNPPTQIDVGDAAVVGVATTAAREDHQHALPAPAAPVNVTKAAAAAGVSTTVARADHKHDVTTAVPVTVTGPTNVEGVATSLSRSDHLHRLALAVLEEGAATGARPTVNFIGGAVTAVDNPGLDRVDVTITAAALTAAAPTQIDIGDLAVVGVATDAARADHQHALPVPTVVSTLTPDNAPALGVSTVVAREDHVHGIAANVPVDVTKAANAEGVSASFSRADHKHDVSTAAPITVVGATNAEGVASSLARSDHDHRLEVQVEEEGVLTASRPTLNFVGAGVAVTDDGGGDRAVVTVTAANVTAAGTPTQIDIGDAGVVGVSADAARSDHQHALPVPTVVSTLTPDNAPALGVSTVVAREDHVHGIAADVPITVVGATNAEGASTSFSRANHQHRLEVQVQEEGVLTSSRPTLNFVGAGVTVTDDGGGDRATVTIPGTDVDRAFWFWGNSNVGAAADTRFLSPGRDNSAIALTVDVAQIPILRDGTLQRLRIRHNAAVGNGNSVVYTVMKNGVATAITATLATGAIGEATDLVNTVAVVAGDRVSLRLTKAAGIAAAGVEAEASLEIAY